MSEWSTLGKNFFIDSHCHLDAEEFLGDRNEMRERARNVDVGLCLIPSVEKNNFDIVRNMAHSFKDVYALGIHPLYTNSASTEDLFFLKAQLTQLKSGPSTQSPSNRNDPRLVAIGEIGLDGAIKTLDWNKQVHFFEEQLKIAADFDLPVILHVRQAVDFVLKGLRQYRVKGGIAHAFNGSEQQAEQFIDLGFKLGVGGALTYPRALHLRRLVKTLPRESIVLETDSPDIVPVWLYVNSQARANGQSQGRNEPSELPRIGKEIAELRGETLEELMHQTTLNFYDVLGLNGQILNQYQ